MCAQGYGAPRHAGVSVSVSQVTLYGGGDGGGLTQSENERDAQGALRCTDARLPCAQVFERAQGAVGADSGRLVHVIAKNRVKCCPDCVGHGGCRCDGCGRAGCVRMTRPCVVFINATTHPGPLCPTGIGSTLPSFHAAAD